MNDNYEFKILIKQIDVLGIKLNNYIKSIGRNNWLRSAGANVSVA